VKYRLCKNCGSSIPADSRFCPRCGEKVINESKSLTGSDILLPLLLYALFLSLVLFVRISGLFYDWRWILVSDFAAIVLVFGFFLADWSRLKPLLHIQKFQWSLFSVVIVVSVIWAIGVNFLADWLSMYLFDTRYLYYDIYRDAPWSLGILIFSIALQPAVTEEPVFRGIIYTRLRKAMRPAPVIILTASLFTLLHFDFIAALWLFPMGLFYGWLRERYQTIWYGVAAHFTHNLVIVLLEYYLYV